MGLDFTYKGVKDSTDTPHWSYGGFNRFREKLALEFNIILRDMKGFAPMYLGEQQMAEWNKTAKDWSIVKSPIKWLLSHSDCDGQISAKRCEAISPLIVEAIKGWDDEDYDKKQGMLLADTMKSCAKTNTPLIFT